MQAALCRPEVTLGLRAALLDPLCCGLLLNTYDVTYWIQAHLVWQTSEKYPSKNLLGSSEWALNLGIQRVSKTGREEVPYRRFSLPTTRDSDPSELCTSPFLHPGW